MTTRQRFGFVVLGALLLARVAPAQEAPAEPAPPPPSDVPAPSEPPAPAPAPSEPAPPPSEPPAPPAAEPSPPVLAPLPPEPPAPKPALAPRPAPSAERAFPIAPPPAAAPPPPPERPSPVPPPTGADQGPERKKPPADDDSEPRDGLFGPFRIGPLFGAGLPSLLSLGGEIRLTRYFGAGVRVGIIPAVHFSYYGEATVSYQDYGAYAHLHPLGGGFLLGAELGYALVKGSYKSQISTATLPLPAPIPGLPSSIDITSDGSVETLVLTPEIGYIFTWRAGFTFGFDAGIQLPVASSHVTLNDHVSAVGIPQQYLDSAVAPDREKVRSTLEKVGQTILPTFHLRIGWLL